MSRETREERSLLSYSIPIILVVCVIVIVGMVTALWQVQVPVEKLFVNMEWHGWYAFAVYLAIPCAIPFLYFVSPWERTSWDYVYAFTAACMFGYILPAVSFIFMTAGSIISQYWTSRTVTVNIGPLIFVNVLLILAPFFLLHAMSSYTMRERIGVESGHFIDTTAASFVITLASIVIIAAGILRLFSGLQLVLYMMFAPIIISAVFALSGLAAYIKASPTAGAGWFGVTALACLAAYFAGGWIL